MTKYDPRKNAEGYNDPTPYAAEKHMMAQIRGKQARVAGGYFENNISARPHTRLTNKTFIRYSRHMRLMQAIIKKKRTLFIIYDKLLRFLKK